MSMLGDSLQRKGSKLRRSLRGIGKKKNGKKSEAPGDVSEDPRRSLERTEEKNEKTPEEIDELYILPELPESPLSGTLSFSRFSLVSFTLKS